MIKCDTCINKTEISEAELYCMSYYYEYGKVFDWCIANNSSIDYMVHLGCNFNECKEYKKKGLIYEKF